MRRITYIVLLIFIIQGCTKAKMGHTSDNSPISLLTTRKDFDAGEEIALQFEADTTKGLLLMITNAFGTSIINPILNEEGTLFQIPSQFTQKAGQCKWQLLRNQNVEILGEISIIPNSVDTGIMETYLGPRSINVGDTDFTMLVVAPTDLFDNPFLDGTKVVVKHQFEDTIEIQDIEVSNLMAWTTIWAPKKAGRILATALCNNTNSKELTTIVYPANAIDFTIDFETDHSYADGNQIITFLTSDITDKYGNRISDGTLVTFIIRNEAGVMLQTTGTIINGSARAKLLHPSKKETWEVTAFITGAAKSKPISVGFEAAVTNYYMSWDNDQRTITVGPIKSFMGQEIPDGLEIQLSIYDSDNTFLETKITTSEQGIGNFILTSDNFLKGIYKIEVQTAGIIKTQTLEIK